MSTSRKLESEVQSDYASQAAQVASHYLQMLAKTTDFDNLSTVEEIDDQNGN